MEDNTINASAEKTRAAVSRVTRSDMGRLGAALFGGILVLDSYLAGLLFSARIDQFTMDLFALVGAVILSIPIFWEAGRDLFRGVVGMNELVALALLGAFASGSSNYRTAGAVAFFMLISITIEKRTAIGAEAAIEAVVRMTPRTARRIKADGSEEECDAIQDLNVGDICRVRPGENFPADGKITSGVSTVNQASITGESLPTDKSLGDEVYAGTLNLTGLVEFKVTRKGTDTTLGKVRNLIADAEQSKMPIQRMIDQYIGYYTRNLLVFVGDDDVDADLGGKLLDGDGRRVVGVVFDGDSHLHKLRKVAVRHGIQAGHLQVALGQGAGLVKDDCLDLGNKLNLGDVLDENAQTGGGGKEDRA